MVVVLAVILALSSAQNVFSSQWIIYDNNNPSNNGFLAAFVGVRFSLPTGVSSAHLLAVSFYWIETTDTVQGSGMVMAMSPQDQIVVYVHITGASPSTATELTSFIPVMPSLGWNPVDVSSRSIVVSGDFYVAIEQPVPITVAFDIGSSNFEGRSVGGDSLDHVTNSECCGGFGPRNFMIRAEIEPIVSPIGPVGGFMEPVNKLVVFAPYLTLFGLVATVAVVVVAPYKKHEN